MRILSLRQERALTVFLPQRLAVFQHFFLPYRDFCFQFINGELNRLFFLRTKANLKLTLQMKRVPRDCPVGVAKIWR